MHIFSEKYGKVGTSASEAASSVQNFKGVSCGTFHSFTFLLDLQESVDLALPILDGFNLLGKEVHVEKATFQLKGEFDPSKKRKKLTNAQKKRYMED
ncbi:unnamed protein product [Cylicocyclus nassatus]|uniref:Uncharacterized protein n=1 Tax=Cylicocyclus nassatus TaxID=53992 RepID=A0AA36GX34_CYLNA|nr:unnamed protein product [Cylicocyclus nassatus]